MGEKPTELDRRKRKILYLIGDSNTQFAYNDYGFAAQLSAEYSRRLDVLNRGYSGYTSKTIRIILPKLLSNDHQPKGCIHAATILLGTNDSKVPELEPSSVPVEETRENLLFIVQALKVEGVKNIVLLCPPPVNVKKWDEVMLSTQKSTGSFTLERVKKYSAMCKQLAEDHGMVFVDLYGGIIEKENWKEFFVDGLHFSKLGNDYVFQRLKEVLDPMLANVEAPYPPWDSIDYDQLETVLG